MNFAQVGPVDRVAEALSIYAIQEAQAIASNPLGWKQDAERLSLKQHFYKGISAASFAGMTKMEKRSLSFVRHHIRRMNALMQPTWWRKIAYHPASIFVRNQIFRRHGEFRKLESRLRKAVHDEVRTLNVHAAQQSLTAAGFRIPMESVMKQMMNLEMPHFHFRYADPTRCKNAEFILYFERVPQGDYYHFQSFDAISVPDQVNKHFQEGPPGNRLSTRIESTGPMFTASEAAVLVNGGHVSRMDGDREHWVAINTDHTSINTEPQFTSVVFDIEKALDRLPVKNLNQSQQEKLKSSLRAGQIPTVELVIGGRLQKCKIKAKPADGTIAIYHMDGKKLDIKASAGSHQQNADAAQTLRVVTDSEHMNKPGMRPIK